MFEADWRIHSFPCVSPAQTGFTYYKWIGEAKLQKIFANIKKLSLDSQSRGPEFLADNVFFGIGIPESTAFTEERRLRFRLDEICGDGYSLILDTWYPSLEALGEIKK